MRSLDIRSTVAMVQVALTLLLAHRPANAVCLPEDSPRNVTVVAQIVVTIDDTPSAVIRCGVAGGEGQSQWRVPTTRGDATVRPATVAADWDTLWLQTDPRIWERRAPQVGIEYVHVPFPEPSLRLSPPSAQFVDGDVTFVESNARGLLPEGTQGLIIIDTNSLVSNDFTWLPAVEVDLVEVESGWELPLAVMASGEFSDGGRYQGLTTYLALGETYYAPVGVDVLEAVFRLPDTLQEIIDASSPGTPVVIPSLQAVLNLERTPTFIDFYSRRMEELRRGAVGPVAVLQYAGRLGDSSPLLAPTLSSSPSAAFAVRTWIDQAAGAAPVFQSIPPLWYTSTFVALPDDPIYTSPGDPSEIQLTEDDALFRFGAEAAAQLNPTLILEAINDNQQALMACDPGVGVTNVDAQFVVESGGTISAVFIDTMGNDEVSQCLIDSLLVVEFPIATGPPISVRVPFQYAH